MAKPVVIYLDSQDYSKFSDLMSGGGDKSLQPALDRLLAEINTGRVVAPFSMAHVSELIQYEGGGRELALRKAKTLETITQGHAFRYILDLVFADLARFASAKKLMKLPKQFGPKFPLSTEWHWHPTLEGIAFELKNSFDAQFKELAASLGLTPGQCRKLKASLLTPGFNNPLADGISKISAEYPVSDRFLKENMLLRFLVGKLPIKRFEQELLISIAQPTRFVVWYFEKFTGDKDIPAWMRNFGMALLTIMETARKDFATLGIDISTPAFSTSLRSMVTKLVTSLSLRFLEQLSDDFSRAGLSKHNLEKLKAEKDLTTGPTLNLIGRLIEAYVKDNLRTGQSMRQLRPSDAGDIVHALYIPYADIWRCDRYFATIARQAVGSTDTEILADLRELPAAIDRALLRANSLPSS